MVTADARTAAHRPRVGMKGHHPPLSLLRAVTHHLLYPSWWLPPEGGWEWGWRTLTWKGVVCIGVYDGYVRTCSGGVNVCISVSLCAGVHMSQSVRLCVSVCV